MGPVWVSSLQSANNDHTFELVLAYLDALGADLKVAILLQEQEVPVVTAKLGMTKEEVDAVMDTLLE